MNGDKGTVDSLIDPSGVLANLLYSKNHELPRLPVFSQRLMLRARRARYVWQIDTRSLVSIDKTVSGAHFSQTVFHELLDPSSSKSITSTQDSFSDLDDYSSCRPSGLHSEAAPSYGSGSKGAVGPSISTSSPSPSFCSRPLWWGMILGSLVLS